MLSEAMSEVIVRYGFPGFWVGVGVVQWFWPSAIFVAFSDDEVTPGARGFAVFWMVIGSALGLAFIPLLEPFDGLFIPGFVLLIVGILQWMYPAWSSPIPDRFSSKTLGIGIGIVGTGVLLWSLL